VSAGHSAARGPKARPLGTDRHKPFLENAPWLIAIFVQKWGRAADGRKVKHLLPV